MTLTYGIKVGLVHVLVDFLLISNGTEERNGGTERHLPMLCLTKRGYYDAEGKRERGGCLGMESVVNWITMYSLVKYIMCSVIKSVYLKTVHIISLV